MLNNFQELIWHPHLLFGEVSAQIFCPVVYWVVYFTIEIWEFFMCYSWIHVLCPIYDFKVFSLNMCFILFKMFFTEQNLFFLRIVLFESYLRFLCITCVKYFLSIFLKVYILQLKLKLCFKFSLFFLSMECALALFVAKTYIGFYIAL